MFTINKYLNDFIFFFNIFVNFIKFIYYRLIYHLLVFIYHASKYFKLINHICLLYKNIYIKYEYK